MKIVLFLNNDIHCKSSLALLLEHFKNHHIKIVISQRVGKKKVLPDEIVAMQKLEKYEVYKDATSYADINSDEAFADLKKFFPDLMISIRYGQIFKRADIISLPRFGIINLHSGMLPKYRGIMASFWAILSGEENIGMTLHYIINSGIDTGPIIDSFKHKIDRNLSLLSNITNLYPRGCEMIIKAVDKIFAGEKISMIDQKTLGQAGYFSYPAADDVKNFSKRMNLF